MEDILRSINGPAWMLVLIIYLPKIVEAIKSLGPYIESINATLNRVDSKFRDIENRLENIEVTLKYQGKLYDDISRSDK